MIDFEIKSLTYFDSCGGSTTPFFVDEKPPGDKYDRRHPILKMWEFMIYWSHCKKTNLRTHLWKFYYDDGNRKRDRLISYAYQTDETSCGLFVIATAECLTFRPSQPHNYLRLNMFLGPKRIFNNHYRLVIATLIMLFKQNQFPILIPSIPTRQFDFNNKILSLTQDELQSSFAIQEENQCIIPDSLDINIHIDRDIKQTYWSAEDLNIHNKMAYQLATKKSYSNILAYRYAKEETKEIKQQKIQAARKSYVELWEELKLQSKEKYCSRVEEIDYSHNPHYCFLMEFALAIPKNYLFDFGFKITSADSTKLKWYNKICHCPLSKESKIWRELFNLDWLDILTDPCDCPKNKTPYELMEHLKSKRYSCVYHRLVYEYMQNYYSNFWKGKVASSFESNSHYALHDLNSSDYNDAMLSWKFYADESEKVHSVDGKPPTITYHKSWLNDTSIPNKNSEVLLEQQSTNNVEKIEQHNPFLPFKAALSSISTSMPSNTNTNQQKKTIKEIAIEKGTSGGFALENLNNSVNKQIGIEKDKYVPKENKSDSEVHQTSNITQHNKERSSNQTHSNSSFDDIRNESINTRLNNWSNK